MAEIMNQKDKTLEQRIEEYVKYYEYYSWKDDFPLLSIRPKERVLVVVSVATGPYAVFEGDTLIVGTVDEKTDVHTPVCAATVVRVNEEKMLLDDIVKVFGVKEYDRILFDIEYTEEEKNIRDLKQGFLKV